MIPRDEQAYLVQAWEAAPDATHSREAQEMIAHEIARIHQAFRDLPIQVAFVAHDPYSSFEQMRDQVQSTGQMLVYTGASETPLWDPQTNWMARAVHDWDHIVRSCDFSMEGEAAAYRHAAACRPGLAPLYLSEIMLQAAIANYSGGFAPQKLVLAPENVRRRATQMRGVPGRKRSLGTYRVALVPADEVSEYQVLVQYLGDWGSGEEVPLYIPERTFAQYDLQTKAAVRKWFSKITTEDVEALLAVNGYDHYTNYRGGGGNLRGVGSTASNPTEAALVWTTAGLLRVTTPAMAMVHLHARGVSAEDALVVVDAAQQLNNEVDAEAATPLRGLGAVTSDAPIDRKALRVGDEIGVVGTRHHGQVSGTITSIGRVNVKITSRVRFAPDGPVHTQTHTIPINDIDVVARDGEVVFDRRGLHVKGLSGAAALQFGEPVLDVAGTASLAKMKLRAKNDGTLQGAIVSAAYHAKKHRRPMYVWQGNSYMHAVWNVATAPSRSPTENIGDKVFKVTPDLQLYYQVDPDRCDHSSIIDACGTRCRRCGVDLGD